jgi:hypothetical protein
MPEPAGIRSLRSWTAPVARAKVVGADHGPGSGAARVQITCSLAGAGFKYLFIRSNVHIGTERQNQLRTSSPTTWFGSNQMGTAETQARTG